MCTKLGAAYWRPKILEWTQVETHCKELLQTIYDYSDLHRYRLALAAAKRILYKADKESATTMQREKTDTLQYNFAGPIPPPPQPLQCYIQAPPLISLQFQYQRTLALHSFDNLRNHNSAPEPTAAMMTATDLAFIGILPDAIYYWMDATIDSITGDLPLQLCKQARDTIQSKWAQLQAVILYRAETMQAYTDKRIKDHRKDLAQQYQESAAQMANSNTNNSDPSPPGGSTNEEDPTDNPPASTDDEMADTSGSLGPQSAKYPCIGLDCQRRRTIPDKKHSAKELDHPNRKNVLIAMDSTK